VIRIPNINSPMLRSRVSDAFIQRLVDEVTKGFKGDVGVVPRQFLREFVNQLDLVDMNPEYDPAEEYGFSLDNVHLSPEEQQALGAQVLGSADVGVDELVPVEDVW